jgi:hypothetical protein
MNKFLCISLFSLLVLGCGDDDPMMMTPDATPDSSLPDGMMPDGSTPDAMADAGPMLNVPTHYEFESRCMAGESSISHSGQSARQILMIELSSFIGGLTAAIDDSSYDPTTMDVTDRLSYYYSLSGDDRAGDALDFSTTPALDQMTWGDISGARLQNKLSPNDSATDQFAMGGRTFAGWSDASVLTGGATEINPPNLIEGWFQIIEDQALARANGTEATSRTDIPVYVTDNGVDLRQLINKLLIVAVAFSQGADDYLDDDVDGKGLLASNECGDSTYTALEHAWDEGVGYFGAANNYSDWTTAVLAGPSSGRCNDVDMSGGIDAVYECNYGMAVNAAKRDKGSAMIAATSYRRQIWDAFRTGRALITAADGPLSADELTQLRAQRDLVVTGWEQVIMGTLLHYINDTLEALSTCGTDAYDYLDHIKYWAEMKAYGLAAQFNRNTPMTTGQFAELHGIFGDAPVLCDDPALEGHKAALRRARMVLATAYGFAPGLLGDENGIGGW